MSSKRVAIITGAALGIGRAVVEKMLRAGHTVFGLDINTDALAQASRDLEPVFAGQFWGKTVNVTDEEGITCCFDSILSQTGRIDILVNNAGGSGSISQSIEDIPPADWDRIVSLNLRSTYLCIRAAVPSMKKERWGRIVNMSSMAGRSRSLFGGAPYAASKAAIIGLTRQISRDLGPFGITVNAVAPGLVLSGERIESYWNNKKTPEERNGILTGTPMRRAGTAEDIASGVAFIVGEEASFITGAVLDINGGYWVG